ncbi:hypothetical protein [Streptomyces melanogenes]|uniref:hypothetical protein n=1 Tax=Streptomyces melanogenes TaxID=67326 RepID=UPI00167D6CA8|nr:hypothetical protein [Streptomyces melanogenes]
MGDPSPVEPNEQEQTVPEPTGQDKAEEEPAQGQAAEEQAENAPAEEESPQEGLKLEAATAGAGAADGPCGNPNSRQPRGVWTEGPGAPSPGHPGAKFSVELYNSIARMPNKEFINLRNRVIKSRSADPRAAQLKRSFYADGCSYPLMKGLGNWISWQSTVDACLQHDFRYTVGPNTLTQASQKADRSGADLQLGINIQEGGHFDSIPNGYIFYKAVDAYGRDHYVTQPGTVGEKTIGSMADLNAILQASSS